MKKLFNLLSISIAMVSTVSAAQTLPVPFNAIREISCQIVPRDQAKATRPHIKIQESTSLNWSGYAALTSLTNPRIMSVSMVSGTWNVPQITSSPTNAYSSAWVGMDGYASNTVEQIGTEHDWYQGRAQYYAWFEMYPQYAYELVGFPVRPGDSISAQVNYLGNNVFRLAITNQTEHVSFTIPYSYTRVYGAQRNSAEWIVEAPSSNQGVLPLAHFSPVTMSNCQATMNGITGPINSSYWQHDPLTMTTQSGIVKAQPSSLSGGNSFTVTWEHQ